MAFRIVLISISNVIVKVEHIFVGLGSICNFFPVNSLFVSFACTLYFLLGYL